MKRTCPIRRHQSSDAWEMTKDTKRYFTIENLVVDGACLLILQRIVIQSRGLPSSISSPWWRSETPSPRSTGLSKGWDLQPRALRSSREKKQPHGGGVTLCNKIGKKVGRQNCHKKLTKQEGSGRKRTKGGRL